MSDCGRQVFSSEKNVIWRLTEVSDSTLKKH